MFVFRHDESTGKENSRAIPANKLKKDGGDAFPFQSPATLESISETNARSNEHSNNCLAVSSVLNLSASTEYSTELSNFSLNSDDSGSSLNSSYSSADEDDQSHHHPTTLSNVLYKPSFDSPVDRLLRATNSATSKREAMDIFHKLQTWVTIEARTEEIETHSWEIQHRAIPELLEFVRFNVDDKECVSEALALVQTLASLSDAGESQLQSQSQSQLRSGHSKALLLIDAQAINVLVLALLSHNNHNNSISSTSITSNRNQSHSQFAAIQQQQQQQQQQTCLFQRLWTFLMEIILCPSAVEYFQQCDESSFGQRYYKRQQQKEHQRMRLVTAVDLCLDRLLHSSFSISAKPNPNSNHCYLEQIFTTLAMLLRIQNTEGNLQSNKSMRVLVWEKQIVPKCQQIMANRIDAAAWENFEGFSKIEEQQQQDQDQHQHQSTLHQAELDLSMIALSVFEIFLCDCDDDLSLSVNGAVLEDFVYKALPNFPLSMSIQIKGCQILNEVASRRNNRSVVTELPSPTASPIFLSLTAASDRSDNHSNQSQTIDAIAEDYFPKEKVSFVHLVKTFFQKPCLCDKIDHLEALSL